ncbi:MAG: hypothetical protein IKQ20_11720 [Bacteroidales bacterium]|nr:hypothetical protein [Bacteroidales bacterium]
MMKNKRMISKPMDDTMPSCPDLAVEDVSFDDLQPVFDEQSRRIDAVVGGRERLPHSLNFAGLRTYRRRMLRRWCLLAVASAAVAVYWGIDLWHHNFDIYYRIFTLFLEAVFVFIMVDSTVSAVSIAQSSPVGSSLDRISYKANAAEPSKIRIQNSKFDLSRPVNIGIAASVTLVMVACATSVGDGYTMSQDHNARIEAVENVQSILNNI